MYVNFGGNGFYDARSLALKRCMFQVARCRFGLRKYAMPFTMFRIYVFGCEAPSKSKACPGKPHAKRWRTSNLPCIVMENVRVTFCVREPATWNLSKIPISRGNLQRILKPVRDILNVLAKKWLCLVS